MRVIYFRGRQGCAVCCYCRDPPTNMCITGRSAEGKRMQLFKGLRPLPSPGSCGRNQQTMKAYLIYCTGLHFGEILARLISSSKFTPENIPKKCIALSTLFCILKPSLSRAEHSFHKQECLVLQLFDQPLN